VGVAFASDAINIIYIILIFYFGSKALRIIHRIVRKEGG